MQDDLTALLIYARYMCTNNTCAGGQPCMYGAKLLGTARRLPGTEPRVAQLDAVPVQPSVPPAQGKGRVPHARRDHACQSPMATCTAVLAVLRHAAALLSKPVQRLRLLPLLSQV